MKTTEQALELESAMAEMLQLSEWKFFKIMINMLRDLKAKAQNMQEHMGNVTIEMKILRKIQKEKLEI